MIKLSQLKRATEVCRGLSEVLNYIDNKSYYIIRGINIEHYITVRLTVRNFVVIITLISILIILPEQTCSCPITIHISTQLGFHVELFYHSKY